MKLGVVVASVGGVSVAGVATVGGYHYFSSKNTSIKEALKDAKLISSLSGSALTKQWEEEFKSAKDDIKKEIKELKDVTEDDDGGRKLEAWCSSQMHLDSKKHSEAFELVKKYCLIRSVSSQLSRTNKNLLGENQENEGNATYTQRKTRTTARSDVNLSGDGSGGTKTQDLQVIKPGCSSNNGKDFLATEDLYTKVLKGCTVEGAQEN